MIIHILKNGTVLTDITGHVVKDISVFTKGGNYEEENHGKDNDRGSDCVSHSGKRS